MNAQILNTLLDKTYETIYQSCQSCQELLQAKVTAPPWISRCAVPCPRCVAQYCKLWIISPGAYFQRGPFHGGSCHLGIPKTECLWYKVTCADTFQTSRGDQDYETTKPNKVISCIRRRGLIRSDLMRMPVRWALSRPIHWVDPLITCRGPFIIFVLCFDFSVICNTWKTSECAQLSCKSKQAWQWAVA